MKPKTEAQREAVAINNTLDETISRADKEYAIKKVESDPDYSKLSRVWFTVEEGAYPDWTINRLYLMYAYKNKTGMQYLCIEILRNFKKGKHNLMFGKLRGMYGEFLFDSNIELRCNRRDYDGYNLNNVFSNKYFSIERHYGEEIKCVRTNPDNLNKILSIPYGETLYNAEEKNLINHLLCRNYKKEFLASIRIAKKHGFTFTEENSYEWFDMVYCIIKTKNDNHNPKYVAPGNLNEMHNYFLKKYQSWQRKKEEQAEERAMARREKMQLDMLKSEQRINEDYIKRRKRFYDLNISDSKFDIHVLRDVQEFFEEGTTMHHCVFSMKYYKKPDSLIMSCRDKQGNRVETIEVDLKTFKIAQCYGKYDQFTEHHEHLRRLVNKNMNKIRWCYASKGTKKAKDNNIQIAI